MPVGKFDGVRRLSVYQIEVLRNIAEHGLVVPSVTLDGPLAMAHLGSPTSEIVRITTARRFARDGLIAAQRYTPPPGEVVIDWEITKVGRTLLRDHQVQLD